MTDLAKVKSYIENDSFIVLPDGNELVNHDIPSEHRLIDAVCNKDVHEEMILLKRLRGDSKDGFNKRLIEALEARFEVRQAAYSK